MVKTRALLTAWLLLLGAALLIGGMALFLLDNARDNLAIAAAQARRERLVTVAESIDLAVGESREALAATLLTFPDDHLADSLDSWRLDNPLIRNVFIWSPRDGLRFPAPGQPGSAEEHAFRQRFDELFAGRTSWAPPRLETPAPVQTRRELLELAKTASSARQTDLPPAVTGWTPWFWQEGLHLLVWAERPDGVRFGLEVEMAALLSRLVTLLPEPTAAGETWALLDDRGRVVHQRGPDDLGRAGAPALALPVGPNLPHWQVGLYTDAAAAPPAQGVLVLGGVLTLILVVAILSGGSLLLWQARRSLRDARLKSGFVANVSHELKTPLTTIRMYAELLAEQDGGDPGRRRRYLDVICSEAQRLTRLVNNLLDFSRMEQGRKQYHHQAIDLGALVARTMENQAMRLAEAGCVLDLQLPETPVPMATDPDAVAQALLNLVDNALKYAAGGGQLEVALHGAGNRAELTVSDRGPGIPAAHAERIFDIFHRIDDTLTTRQPGTGLGLSIARQLLRDLGGDLVYRPRHGGGACFVISLPVKPTAAGGPP